MKTRTIIIIGIIMISTIPFATFAILDKYSNYVEQLNYIAENKSKEPKPGEKYYIEPELKAKLEEVEFDLRDKVREIHRGMPPSSYAVNLDHHTKEIVVIIENKDLISKIEDITKQYPDDVSFVITRGKITLDDFNKTWDGPGTHPALLGYDIPEICTDDMIKHLVKHSSMFDRNSLYMLEWISMDDSINVDDFDRCVDSLLERNPRYTDNENILYGKPLSYWQNLDEDSLVQHYENFGKSEEKFFEDLGALLVKSHSDEELDKLGIIPIKEIEIDWTGIRPSLPPRMGFDAKVNSTDGKNYLITGTIHGNVILDNFQIVEDNGRRIEWTPAFDYSRVQINGTAALQICSMLEIACTETPVWDAVHRHDKDFTYFYYDTYGVEPDVQIGEHYIQIDKNQICHSFEDLLSQQISELECQEIRK
jgi:hypothetical protein